MGFESIEAMFDNSHFNDFKRKLQSQLDNCGIVPGQTIWVNLFDHMLATTCVPYINDAEVVVHYCSMQYLGGFVGNHLKLEHENKSWFRTKEAAQEAFEKQVSGKIQELEDELVRLKSLTSFIAVESKTDMPKEEVITVGITNCRIIKQS